MSFAVVFSVLGGSSPHGTIFATACGTGVCLPAAPLLALLTAGGDSTRLSSSSVTSGTVTSDDADAILPFDEEIAEIWGRLRVPHAKSPLDKQIAATALLYGLTVVTRNVPHYEPTGVVVLNPFA